jgi:hypothetical protein
MASRYLDSQHTEAFSDYKGNHHHHRRSGIQLPGRAKLFFFFTFYYYGLRVLIICNSLFPH